MTVTVWEQLRSLSGALLLGLGAGLWYDLLRCLRRRIRGQLFAAVLDLLFWLAVTAAIFLWSVAAGNGTVQLSCCAALFLGAVIYFRVLSRCCFPLLSALTGLIAGILHLIGAPWRWLKQMVNRGQKFFSNFCKNHFSFPGK